MAQITFNMVITTEGLTYARQASVKPGWYIIPKRFGVSNIAGALDKNRTTLTMNETWYTSPFSGVYPSSTNKLLNSVVIAPNAYPIQIQVAEIYFIYETPNGEEFLYAIAQPTEVLPFVPGVAQDYVFSFTLNDTNVSDTYLIDYTFPQDIEDHNQREDAHEELFKRKANTSLDNLTADAIASDLKLGVVKAGNLTISSAGELYSSLAPWWCFVGGPTNTSGEADVLLAETSRKISYKINGSYNTESSSLEKTTAGSYSIMVNARTQCTIQLVGAGGASYARYRGDRAGLGRPGWTGIGCWTGGGGAYINATITLPAGKYTLKVGQLGNGSDAGSSVLYNSDGVALLTAGGGGNANVWAAGTQKNGGTQYDGTPGTAGTASKNTDLINSIDPNAVVSLRNGYSGSYRGQNGGTLTVQGASSLYNGYGRSQTAQAVYHSQGNITQNLSGGSSGYVKFISPGTSIVVNKELVLRDASGKRAIINNIEPDYTSSLSNGTYNVLVSPAGVKEVLKNTIYRQPAKPSNPKSGDVWCNTSEFEFDVQKYNGSIWEEYDKIPLGSFTIESGNITYVQTFPYGNRSATQVNSCRPAVVIKNYQNGSSWYRVWSDGWIEQGGAVNAGVDSTGTITLMKAFKTTNYTALLTLVSGTQTINNSQTGPFYILSKSTNSFRWINDANGGSMGWVAYGY